jgi:hydroxyquinol 1,2-dioxygenase
VSTRNLSEKSITNAVITRMERARSKRFKEVMTSLVKHLHQFARDVELTEQEWEFAIDFLTRTGQKCDATRQEFILLSDTLGLSTLVTQLNHRSHDLETEQTVFGPFHRLNAPEFGPWGDISEGVEGKPCFITVTVRDAQGRPVKGAVVDVWHSDDVGFYDVQRQEWGGAMKLRGVFHPDATGTVKVRTIVPKYYPVPTDGPVGQLLKASARHPMRPAHVHFMVQAPGYDRLVTHVFVNGDKYLDSDAVFGVRSSLIRDFVKHKPGVAPDGSRQTGAWYTMEYDFVMRPLRRKGANGAAKKAVAGPGKAGKKTTKKAMK